MRRWLWAALGVSGLASACDRTEGGPAVPDPAATAPSAPAVDAARPDAEAAAGERSAIERKAPGDAGPADAPLARWMDANAAKAMRDQDLYLLAETFDAIARYAPDAPPPAFANWVSIAKDGAAAARAASLEGAKGACRGCHAEYRDTYRATLRARPLPQL